MPGAPFKPSVGLSGRTNAPKYRSVSNAIDELTHTEQGEEMAPEGATSARPLTSPKRKPSPVFY